MRPFLLGKSTSGENQYSNEMVIQVKTIYKRLLYAGEHMLLVVHIMYGKIINIWAHYVLLLQTHLIIAFGFFAGFFGLW